MDRIVDLPSVWRIGYFYFDKLICEPEGKSVVKIKVKLKIRWMLPEFFCL